MDSGTPLECLGVSLRAAPPEAVARLQEEGCSLLAARVFAARGICRREQITPPLKSLPPALQLPGVKEMCAALARVCAEKEKLCIVGDYDADGITSTVLATDCLTHLGADVCWFIPSRYTNGYGLTSEIVECQAQAGVKHILTVDNGTTAHIAIARAKELGITVYVIDHHQPDETANAAAHLVNPQVANGAENCFRALVGVGLTFYVMAQLRSVMNVELHMSQYLDLVALGTIADCGQMDAINRTLTAGGLMHMRAGKIRPGLTALATSSKVGLGKLNSRDVGYRLAPRINAAGRLGSADVAMHCLLAPDIASAREYAEQLEALNSRRLQLQQEAYALALQKVDDSRRGIAIADEQWNPGIVGIIAGKIAERFHRPAIIMHRDSSGDWRGSGRSAGTVDLIAVLRTVAKAHPGMLLNYGGHRQAAGVQVSSDCLPAFADAFDSVCAEAVGSAPPPPLQVDAFSSEGLSRDIIMELDAVPWGAGFAAPNFAGTFEVREQTAIRGGNVRLRLMDVVCGMEHGAVLFGRSELPRGEIAALYSATLNPYDGEVQLIIQSVLTPDDAGD